MRIIRLIGLLASVLEHLAKRTYDLVVLCEPVLPFVQDGTRQEPAFRLHQHAWYQQELNRRRVPHLTVGGTVAEREAAVATALKRLPQT
jgi:HTH-type transcriptional regulator, transcriptional repressor of NAD biosynthesis genes